jgi:hypothetical protein
MSDNAKISTGLASLDNIVNCLLPGDNVVWHTPSVEEYKTFVTPYVQEAWRNGHKVHYIRFADHPPLLDADENTVIHELDAGRGFESFSAQIHSIIKQTGLRAYFVFDCLSALLSHWATDSMTANMFMVTCPYLYKVKALAYFCILKNHHSFGTISKIKNTTQLFIEVYNSEGVYCIHPHKVFQRSSPTMFLPHKQGADGIFRPVVNSAEATGLFYSICSLSSSAQKKLDSWDRMMLRAKELLSANPEEQSEVFDTIARCLIGREDKILELVKKHFRLRDLLDIKSRMIGTGFIGGKAVGMLLARQILKNCWDADRQDIIEPHDSYFVGADVFHTYIIHNGWWDMYMEHRTEAGYLEAGAELERMMLNGHFPDEITEQFRAMLDYFGQYPIVVRSSSILEDGFGNAFAGKYESFFCSVQGTPETRLKEFLYNLKRVYASAMCQDALEYRKSKKLDSSDEQMGVLIQRVSGCFHGFYYYPHAAGVGLSYNTYVWHDDIDPDAGMLRLVAGLGTRAVNRVKDDYPRIVALNAPEMTPVNDINDIKKYSQRMLDVLDTRVSGKHAISLYDLYNDNFPFNINKIAIHDRNAEQLLAARGRTKKDIWILTFERLLKQTPFPEIMSSLMNTLEREYQYPVDIEFTLNFFDSEGFTINLVQCRPHQTSIISDVPVTDRQAMDGCEPLFRSKSNFMGGNVMMNIHQIVYVDPQKYSRLKEKDKYAVAGVIRQINKQIEICGRNTLLLGPGRWGTSTPSLGVPVGFADINHMKAIGEIEFEEGGLIPELSFGSHFFQDLVEGNIFFMALFPNSTKCTFSGNIFKGMENHFKDAVKDADEFENVVNVHRFDTQPLILYSDIRSQELMLLIRQI